MRIPSRTVLFKNWLRQWSVTTLTLFTFVVLIVQACLLWKQGTLMERQTKTMQEQAKIAKTQTELQESLVQFQVEPVVDLKIERASLGELYITVHNNGLHPVSDVLLEQEGIWISIPPYEKLERRFRTSRREEGRPILVPGEPLRVPLIPTLKSTLEKIPPDRNPHGIDSFNYALICFRLTYFRSADRRRHTKQLPVLTRRDPSRPPAISPDDYLELDEFPTLQTLASNSRGRCSTANSPS
jgi:hypothetical protein